MIVTGNPLLVGVSGRMKNMVVKQYKETGKIVISAVPDMSGRKLSPKQQDANERMLYAIRSAQHVCGNPMVKRRACDMLQVPPNKVFRAIVKEYLLTDGESPLFQETEQEKRDKKTLSALKTIVITEIPDAEVMLFGNRAKATHNAQSDWDMLVLTTNDHPKTLKWELQEKLFGVTIQQGTRVNILLAQKAKWYTEKEYVVIRKRIEDELVAA
jgi:predicted nucleotidyltransferase